MTTPETVIGLLAEPARLRAFSAVALGSRTPSETGEAAGTSPRETAVALRRLADGGMVLEDDGDGLRVAGPSFFRELTRAARSGQSAQGGDRTEALLRTFVRDGRLRAVPAQFERRRVVLRHLVRGAFRPGVTYTEKQVDETLKDWCAGSTTDHVTIRRYLIDLCLLSREDGGPYWLREGAEDGGEGRTRTLRLEEVTPDNVLDACGLQVRPEQEYFVDSVERSLAEAYVHQDIAWPRLVLDGDRLVGFVMAFFGVRFDADGPQDPPRSGLWRLAVAAGEQGRGYGRFAVRAVCEEVRRRGGRQATVTFKPGEHGPEEFYLRLGFRKNGKTSDGELVAELDLTAPTGT